MTNRIPKGAREYLLGSAEELHAALGLCSSAFEEWGARRVVPSTLVEPRDGSLDENAIAFRALRTGRLTVLRQDITNQICKIVDSELAYLPKPYKLYYIERVWREDTISERSTEQIQAGVEWIGASGGSELRLLQLASNLVAKIVSRPVTMVLGHAECIRVWAQVLECKDPERGIQALVERNLSHWQQWGDPAFPELPIETVEPGTISANYPEPVRQLLASIAAMIPDLPEGFDVVLDPIGSAHESAYYDGLFFKLVSGIGTYPWLRGGRYDNRFESPVGAVGFTLDLDSIIDAIEQGELASLRPKNVGWTLEVEPKPQNNIRWLRLDDDISDPLAWSASHGLDALAVEENNQIYFVDPVSGERLKEL